MRVTNNDFTVLSEDEEKVYEQGVRDVLYIRCIEHRHVPQYNQNVNEHGECAACEVAKWKARLSIAVQALQDIIDPIARFTRNLTPDEELNWQWVHCLAKNPELLRAWAREALAEIGEQAKQEGV